MTFNRELYLAILMDRSHNGPVIVSSPQGGMDIEEVAETYPDAIYTQVLSLHSKRKCKSYAAYQPIDIIEGIKREQSMNVAKVFQEGRKLHQI